MSEKKRRWLMGELPGLVEAGVLSEFYAEALREHYEQNPGSTRRPPVRTVCGILGALLIGGGVILLFGHNWNGLSRTVRTVLSLAPLVVTQALGGWVLLSGKTSRAWREPVAGLNTLAAAAAIALVGQTYHIPGDLTGFLLIWMLMTLPLVYLFRALLPALIYLAGITAWGASSLYDGGSSLLFWLLYAAVLPFAVKTLRRDRFTTASAVLSWGLCLQTAWIGAVLERGLPGLWIVIYTGLFGLLNLIGATRYADAPSLWFNPFSVIGRAGTVVIALLLTYEWTWDCIGWNHARYRASWMDAGAWPDVLIAVVVAVSAFTLLVNLVRRGDLWQIPMGVVPAIGVLGYVAVSSSGSEATGMMLFNAYVFAIGLAGLIQGVRERRTGVMNGGMGVLSVLLLLRFFDSELPMIARGILFVLLGVAFLAVNMRRRSPAILEERQ